MSRIECGHPGNFLLTWCQKSSQDDDDGASWWELLNEVQQRGVQREVAFVIESTQHVYVRKEDEFKTARANVK